MRFVNRLKEWLQEIERRRSSRKAHPGLIAYYWDGAVPAPREVKNISMTGLYLHTNARWYPGTIVTLGLTWAQGDAHPSASADSISVNCKVVRHDKEGVGLRFVSLDQEQRKALMRFMAAATKGRDPVAPSLRT